MLGLGGMTHAHAVQVLGSCCFITASILFMLEVQHSWWRIEPFNLGWHVGFWNFVGGVGFWLWCAPRLSRVSKINVLSLHYTSSPTSAAVL